MCKLAAYGSALAGRKLDLAILAMNGNHLSSCQTALSHKANLSSIKIFVNTYLPKCKATYLPTASGFFTGTETFSIWPK